MRESDKEFAWQCDGKEDDGTACQRFGFARCRTAHGAPLKLCIVHVIKRQEEIERLRRALGEEGFEEERAA